MITSVELWKFAVFQPTKSDCGDETVVLPVGHRDHAEKGECMNHGYKVYSMIYPAFTYPLNSSIVFFTLSMYERLSHCSKSKHVGQTLRNAFKALPKILAVVRRNHRDTALTHYFRIAMLLLLHSMHVRASAQSHCLKFVGGRSDKYMWRFLYWTKAATYILDAHGAYRLREVLNSAR